MTIYMRILTRNGLLDTPGGRHYARPDVFQFPGGEYHLRGIPEFEGPATWIADVRGADPADLVKAALLADVAKTRGHQFALVLPYVPAARADRGVPRGAKVYADLINSMQADRVIVLDPHSSEGIRYLRNVRVADHTGLVASAVSHTLPYDAVIAPDAGAVERATAVAERLGILDVYRAEKHRDFGTGRITDIRMVDELPKFGRYLVVDDICDGGGTFIELARVSGVPPHRLGLWVTHGIFSGKATDLSLYYQHICTTDSHPGHNRLGVATTTVPTFVTTLRHVPTPGVAA